MPKLIRDPHVIASVHEGPQPDEADLTLNWDRQSVEIGIGGHVSEVTQHAFLFEQLVRFAEDLAHARWRDPQARLVRILMQLANRLF